MDFITCCSSGLWLIVAVNRKQNCPWLCFNYKIHYVPNFAFFSGGIERRKKILPELPKNEGSMVDCNVLYGLLIFKNTC